MYWDGTVKVAGINVKWLHVKQGLRWAMVLLIRFKTVRFVLLGSIPLEMTVSVLLRNAKLGHLVLVEPRIHGTSVNSVRWASIVWETAVNVLLRIVMLGMERF